MSPEPKTIAEKMSFFEAARFSRTDLSKSHRSVTDLCNFSDKIHVGLGFQPTVSAVKEIELPAQVTEHLGVFVLKRRDLDAYYRRYQPTLLRNNQATERQTCSEREVFNFGQSKGMTFDRTLIFPTARQKNFLQGKPNAFAGGSTDRSLNTFYVAVTRARYSTAFLLEDEVDIDGVKAWQP